MKIAIALLITLVLAVGGTALTFAFRSPDASPKLFTNEALQKQVNDYKKGRDGTLTVMWKTNPEPLEKGRFIYNVNCMTCHGVNGDGKSVTPEALPIRPRDFTGQTHSAKRVIFKYTSLNKADPLALDEDLRKTIKEGLPGTPMPGFSTLSDEDIDALLDYIKHFAYPVWRFEQPKSPALQVPPVPQDLAEQGRTDAGRDLFKSRGCIACHGDPEQGGKPPAELPTDWLNDEGKPIFVMPRNFATDPLRRPAPQDIFKTIRLGIGGTAMPANPLSDEETWDLIAYVLHLQQTGQ